MLALFDRLELSETKNPMEAIRQIAAYLDLLINQLERVLSSLDNLNFGTLDLSDMRLYTETGSEIAGDKIKIVGPNGETFEVGFDNQTKQFVFTMPAISEINVGTLNATTITKGGVEI